MTCLKITESQNGQIYPEDPFSHGAAQIIVTGPEEVPECAYLGQIKNKCVFWVTGNIIFLHFERHFAFQNA